MISNFTIILLIGIRTQTATDCDAQDNELEDVLLIFGHVLNVNFRLY